VPVNCKAADRYTPLVLKLACICASSRMPWATTLLQISNPLVVNQLRDRRCISTNREMRRPLLGRKVA
jgi:hypothetical protein